MSDWFEAFRFCSAFNYFQSVRFSLFPLSLDNQLLQTEQLLCSRAFTLFPNIPISLFVASCWVISVEEVATLGHVWFRSVKSGGGEKLFKTCLRFFIAFSVEKWQTDVNLKVLLTQLVLILPLTSLTTSTNFTPTLTIRCPEGPSKVTTSLCWDVTPCHQHSVDLP